ncbi:valyl-tRNA synthetase [Nematocida homosporus]|uniref:valyl-tRNA synthetase n=1 Tax=Nematocida homosporus TaxID=1912981 RepID=UPI00222013F9|nr:valyl-tRNA synthetase [Nematocida homosporus]KAI5184291.1 valyl-tRNA synthetase [Nematocida homosporus]
MKDRNSNERSNLTTNAIISPEERKAAKLEKKAAKLAKFLSKTKISQNTTQSTPKRKIEFAAATEIVEGEKKVVNRLEGQFNPLQVEAGWFAWWERQGFFKPEYTTKKKNGQCFTIVLPPPNVTGSLHLGHAMMVAIEDSIVRRKRMQGYETLFLPGTDHAGIATQVVVERSLAKEGLTRQGIGRGAFLDRVWEWKDAYGSQIGRQFRRLGASLDFSREKFTMDPDISAGVTEAFVRFYEKGLIYRGERIVNWCAKIQTTLSDLEVEYVSVEPYQEVKTDGSKHVFGKLFTVVYVVELADGRQEKVNVSTTRPETIIGDAALCANPADPRYSHFKGAKAINPMSGAKIPFLFDEAAEIEFGTGVLKITPAHDAVDFAVGKKHNLPIVSVLDKDNRLTQGPFAGQLRFTARLQTVELLRKNGQLVAEEGHAGSIPICSRTGEVVEPRVVPQWWMKCSGLASEALAATQAGKLQIAPAEMEKTWANWLSDTRDWCLSRQLWWGHRIPAYTANGQWYVARTQAEAEAAAGGPVVQEEDVLDTWFSSGLWPFITLGWPAETSDFLKRYPTTILETGKDIIFFWVARMVMMGIALTGKLPFDTALFHSIVRDAHGEKMSKSKGNVIDPVDVITGTDLASLIDRLKSGNLSQSEVVKAEKNLAKEYPHGIEACGSDALRFALLSSASLGRDVNLSIEKVVSCRRFVNKLWNAMKFALAQRGTQPNDTPRAQFNTALDTWITARFAQTAQRVNAQMEVYGFMKATVELHQFLLHDFCDFYVEMYKGRQDSAGLATLQKIVRSYLILLHPFMPFVTEEIYQAMQVQWPSSDDPWMESICIEAYPEPTDLPETSEAIEQAITLIKDIRSTASTLTNPQVATIVLSGPTQILQGAPETLTRLTGLEIQYATTLPDGTPSGSASFLVQAQPTSTD